MWKCTEERMKDSRKSDVRRIQMSIREILVSKWNPIGLAEDLPEDEYDAYIGLVYRALANGCSTAQLAEHPSEIEREYFGGEMTTENSRRAVAEALLQLDINVSTSNRHEM
jgi:hypothetical protein